MKKLPQILFTAIVLGLFHLFLHHLGLQPLYVGFWLVGGYIVLELFILPYFEGNKRFYGLLRGRR